MILLHFIAHFNFKIININENTRHFEQLFSENTLNLKIQTD